MPTGQNQKIGKDSPRFKDRTGEKHITNEGYEVAVIEYLSYENCTIQFKDNKNTVIKNVSFGNILKGNVKNPNKLSVIGIGYIGQGNHRTKYNSILTLEYEAWRGILRRCYSEERQKIQPTYKGCTVDESWHNFQNFAEWWNKNYNPETMQGWHIDKDILVKGNKIYSPKTCCFVPREVNSQFIKSNKTRGKYPIGIYLEKRNNRYIALLSKSAKQIKIGSFNTPEEAFQAYKIAKEAYIKEVADKWRGQITEECYQALINYKVEITD